MCALCVMCVGSGDRSGGGFGVWQCVSHDAERREPQDTSSKEHEYTRQATLLLLAAHHRWNHAAWLAAGTAPPHHVHHRSQVSVWVESGCYHYDDMVVMCSKCSALCMDFSTWWFNYPDCFLHIDIGVHPLFSCYALSTSPESWRS